eukprot:3412184-Rhodomonas_salina.2
MRPPTPPQARAPSHGLASPGSRLSLCRGQGIASRSRCLVSVPDTIPSRSMYDPCQYWAWKSSA